MSFEMKYNADGTPIKAPMPEEMRIAAEAEGQQSVETAVTEDQQEVKSESVTEDLLPEDTQEIEEEPAKEESVQKAIAKPKPNESWKAMRDRIEASERRAALAEEALRNSQQKPSKQTNEDDDVDYTINDDDLVEGKHLSRYDKKIKNLEKKLQQYEHQNTLSTTEVKLKQQYPDFDSIVSAENIANLSAAYPELASSISNTPDLYAKAVSAYTMIKKLGISAPIDTYESDRELVQKNAAKPRVLASISPQKAESPLSRANAFATKGSLTDDMKAQLIREMNESRKGH